MTNKQIYLKHKWKKSGYFAPFVGLMTNKQIYLKHKWKKSGY